MTAAGGVVLGVQAVAEAQACLRHGGVLGVQAVAEAQACLRRG